MHQAARLLQGAALPCPDLPLLRLVLLLRHLLLLLLLLCVLLAVGGGILSHRLRHLGAHQRCLLGCAFVHLALQARGRAGLAVCHAAVVVERPGRVVPVRRRVGCGKQLPRPGVPPSTPPTPPCSAPFQPPAPCL